MVRLTVDLIARGTSGYTKKRTDEGMRHFLRRISHLYLENRNIDEVGDDLAACRNLIVLYLYDNNLSSIPNLNGNGNLTHLYLQNNNIKYINSLTALKKLTKLYLGRNHITVIEGLDKLDMLQELHVEHQHLPPGEKMLFDPRTLATLSRSLQVLNVSGDGLDSVQDLSCLSLLIQLSAADNCLGNMTEMAHLLSSCRNMARLDLMGNPICHKPKYRDRVIIMAPALATFDGKEVTETAKTFLLNWQANKEAVKRKRANSRTPSVTTSTHPSDIMSGGELVPNSMKGSQGHAASYFMPALPRKQFQDVLARTASQPNSSQFFQRTPHNGISGHRFHNGHSPPDAGTQGPRYLNTRGTKFHERCASLSAVDDRTHLSSVTGVPQANSADDRLQHSPVRPPKLTGIASTGYSISDSHSLQS